MADEDRGQAVADDDCPFCRIVRGDDSSAEIICADISWVAFFPPAPATPGHTLIVPREHVPDFWSLREPLASDLAIGALRIGNAIKEVLAPEGMNLITSSGEAAEQTVLHVHLHVVPRWADDEIGPIWPPKAPMDSAVTRDLVDKLRRVCPR